MYDQWIMNNRKQVSSGVNSESLLFWSALFREVYLDERHVWEQWEKCGIWQTRTKDGIYEIINKSDLVYYASTSNGASEQFLDLSIPESLPSFDANTRPLADSLELFQDPTPPESPSPSDKINRWIAEAGEAYLDLSQPGSPPTIDKKTPAPPAPVHPDLEEDIQDTTEICPTTDDAISSRDVDEDKAPIDLMMLWW